MNEQEIRDAVLRGIARIAPEADTESLDPREPLQRALDIDSFDFLNLLVAIREEIGVSVPESDYDKVRTLEEMVKFLASRKPEAG